MREIKFRCYYDNKMHDNNEALRILSNRASGHNLTPAAMVMQFTGLKDRNGIDIYEDDLYRVDLSDKVYRVFFKNGCWYGGTSVEKSEPLFLTYDEGFEYEIPDWFEVIGNIYQNPELL